MDPHLTFVNVSCEDFLENMNHSNYPVVFRDKTRLFGNKKELSNESQFNQCQVLFETFDYEHFFFFFHENKNLIEWI